MQHLPSPISQQSSEHLSATSKNAVQSEPEFAVREVTTIAELIELHRVRLLQGKEQAVAPVNGIKVMEKLSRAFYDPARFALLAAFRGEEIIGYMLLQVATYDYSDADFLVDFGFFVVPEWRRDSVGKALLEDAKVVAERAGLPLHIHIFNPRARRRGGYKSADVIGYVPIGSVITFNAEGG